MKLILLIALILITGCIPNTSDTTYVKYVIDGDTFKTTNDITVRIWGINAPEEDEPYYATATLTLENIIENIALHCNFMGKGKYRRDVMRCYAYDSDIGALMVYKGMAKDYDSVSKGYYLPDEVQAQKAKRGIWSD